MFVQHGAGKKRNMLDGIDMTTLTWGEKTIMVRFDLRKDSQLPSHHHPYEQIGFLVSGRIRLTISGETFETAAGDSWCIPSDAPHEAVALEDSIALEVFSPLRHDYLP
jgi:quercetin dioxygenase-like cupin family protein